jgi:protein-disulfide isomerase
VKTTARPRAALAAAAVLALAVVALAGCARTGRPAATTSADDMSLGDPHAKVQVVEYASASCPHCARFALEVFPAFKAKYVDTGKVRYTLKEYITEPEVLSAGGFLLARCAGKDRYFTVLEAVFRDQGAMVESGDYRTGLLKIARDPGGLSEAQFGACMKDKAAARQLSIRVERHLKVDKVEATPTFVINGRRVEGEMTLPELDAAIAKAGGAA